MKAIMVKNGSTVLSKRVYGGAITDELFDAEFTRLELAYPSYTVTEHEDTDQEFIDAVVDAGAETIL